MNNRSAWNNTAATGVFVAIFGSAIAPSFAAGPKPGVDWPQFRGIGASGVSDGASLPVEWDVEAGKNVRWKTAIPGLGHSCPVVWGDMVFVTTAISGQADPELRVGLYGAIAPVEDDTVHKWMVYCLDKKTGKIVWEKLAHEGVPAIKRHTKATHANCTPATDGKHLVVFFGSEGLHCFDLDGKLLWSKQFGVLDSGYYVVKEAQWEFASSPIIHDGKVIVQCDVQENSFLASFDVETGSEAWRVKRDEVPTWSSPAIVEHGGRKQIVVNGHKHIGGYDFDSGEALWHMRGLGDIPVPTPIFSHGLIFITNAHGAPGPIYAIRAGASGDISLEDGTKSNDGIAWAHIGRGAYMQTPLVYGDLLYNCKDNGILTVYGAATGKKAYGTRLGSGRTGFTASPIAGDGKVYYTSEEGDIYVLKHGPEFQQLAVNQIGEVCMATPAISEGTIFFRTQSNLIAVGNKD